jgi:aspartate 1-decarboxylase
MFIEVLKSKIHRVTVTEADLDYIGSITIDADLLAAANMIENERVDIYNITNGERFSTYAIKTVSGNTNYIKSVTGLKGNTKYYVKIRTYKMVDGTKYLSKWSEAGSITTKA